MLAGQALEVATEASPPREASPFSAAARRPEYDLRSSLPTINRCQSAADLRAWLLKFARDLGFYGARYVHIGTRWWTQERADMPVRFLTTSDRNDEEDEDWLARDPIVDTVRSAFAPFAWSTRIGGDLTEVHRLWLERERARGVAAGVAVPVQDSVEGPAYLSLFGYDEVAVRCLIQEHAPELAFVAAQYHALAKLLIKVGDWVPELSDREIECLRLAAMGKTIRQSGRILGVSARTVEYHILEDVDGDAKRVRNPSRCGVQRPAIAEKDDVGHVLLVDQGAEEARPLLDSPRKVARGPTPVETVAAVEIHPGTAMPQRFQPGGKLGEEWTRRSLQEQEGSRRSERHHNAPASRRPSNWALPWQRRSRFSSVGRGSGAVACRRTRISGGQGRRVSGSR